MGWIELTDDHLDWVTEEGLRTFFTILAFVVPSLMFAYYHYLGPFLERRRKKAQRAMEQDQISALMQSGRQASGRVTPGEYHLGNAAPMKIEPLADMDSEADLVVQALVGAGAEITGGDLLNFSLPCCTFARVVAFYWLLDAQGQARKPNVDVDTAGGEGGVSKPRSGDRDGKVKAGAARLTQSDPHVAFVCTEPWSPEKVAALLHSAFFLREDDPRLRFVLLAACIPPFELRYLLQGEEAFRLALRVHVLTWNVQVERTILPSDQEEEDEVDDVEAYIDPVDEDQRARKQQIGTLAKMWKW